ncbi:MULTISPECIES: NAD-dependent epimerase/dehydratase family protein [unclassified Bradyrhizobium]|uniref:NAD-dependent epimerase/dehydratase family protein n=2 Tax=Bradyrhizobium TaxID=374 RepID=UPI0028EEBC1C|nr:MULTISPECIES: NAD-dependent epimerase/dehydratase family protein [unclassified Bradyrhizobium]
MVGSRIAQGLPGAICVSRQPRPGWVVADLGRRETINLPEAEVIFCATSPVAFSTVMPEVLRRKPRRIVVITSTSVFSKLHSEDARERADMTSLRAAEDRIMRACERAGVEWTILRPSLIYSEGRDQNVTQIARIVRKLRFMPLYGRGNGLRQPVHAEDLGRGAIAAAISPAAANRAYSTTGETITYREMVGRIFDALAMRRRFVSLPPLAWNAAFAIARPLYPGVTPAMGKRMVKDLAFDSSEATADFGWQSRSFAPSFR